MVTKGFDNTCNSRRDGNNSDSVVSQNSTAATVRAPHWFAKTTIFAFLPAASIPHRCSVLFFQRRGAAPRLHSQKALPPIFWRRICLRFHGYSTKDPTFLPVPSSQILWDEAEFVKHNQRCPVLTSFMDLLLMLAVKCYFWKQLCLTWRT